MAVLPQRSMPCRSRLNIGDPNPLTIRDVKRDGDKNVLVDVAAPAGTEVSLFVEGPTPDWALPIPELVSPQPARRQTFRLRSRRPAARRQGGRRRAEIHAGRRRARLRVQCEFELISLSSRRTGAHTPLLNAVQHCLATASAAAYGFRVHASHAPERRRGPDQILTNSLIDRTSPRLAAFPEDHPAVAVMDTQSATASPAGIFARVKALLGGHQRGLGHQAARRQPSSSSASSAPRWPTARRSCWRAGWATSDYGVYVYVWTWVLLLGSMMDFGISASAQKIIPEYRTRGEHALLRGFLSGSRWMTFAVSTVVALALAGLVKTLVAVDRCQHDRSALYRLRHAAGLRGRQHPGRHRALA